MKTSSTDRHGQRDGDRRRHEAGESPGATAPAALMEATLDGLRRLAEAPDARGLFETLLEMLRRVAPFEHALMLQPVPVGTGLAVKLATRAGDEGRIWPASASLDAALAGLVRVVEAGDGAPGSMLLAPLGTGGRGPVLALTHSRRAAFDEDHVARVERLAPLVAHAMAALENRQRLAEHASRIDYLATHDALTGLPNRAVLGERMRLLLAQAQRNGQTPALLLLDVDRFRHVNDSFGHGFGDALLQVVAERVQRAVRDTDTVSRLGADEFVVLLDDIPEAGRVQTVATRILAEVEQPVTIDGTTVFVTACIGAALYPDDGTDLASLMRNADAAMCRAKADGRNGMCFYAPGMAENAREQLELSGALRRALSQGEFELHYQPRVDLRTGALVGMEALVRWRHPDRGLVMPGAFIARAEEDGLIVPIGQWVMETACAQLQAWQRAGLPAVPVAVNVSARQMRHPRQLLEHVGQALERTGLPPALLEIELTESVLLHNPPEVIEVMDALQHYGVRIAVDDFGTGYSSLSYLKRFPVTMLKIDRSFVRDIAEDADDAAIAQAVVSMGHALGLRVVAEGVETSAQHELLRGMACDEAQGYLFSRPLAAERMEAFMRQSVPRTRGRAVRSTPSAA